MDSTKLAYSFMMNPFLPSPDSNSISLYCCLWLKANLPVVLTGVCHCCQPLTAPKRQIQHWKAPNIAKWLAAPAKLGHGPRGPPATGAKKVARQVAGSSVENKAWFWNWNPFSLMEASHFKFGNLEKNLTWGSWSFKTQDSEICFSALSNFGYQSCHASEVLD